MIVENYTWVKKGLIYKPIDESHWWKHTAMAPAAIVYDDLTIRIYVGARDENGISRIAYIDVDADNPSIVKKISTTPILDIGDDGCFDDNGVFPGHVLRLNDKDIYLYYTGFQKLDKIAFSNFSGLAISHDGGNTFKRVSKAPILDRQDEGLYTRAGLSAICENGLFKCCYSVGSDWYFIAGKNRPIYDVNYIESSDGINFAKSGVKVISVNLNIEHGLGRPQIVKLFAENFVFYTRRTLDFRYFMGVAKQENDGTWKRIDDWLNTIKHGTHNEFDEHMVYFPCVIDTGKHIYLFYTGNGYGKDGIGYAELIKKEKS